MSQVSYALLGTPREKPSVVIMQSPLKALMLSFGLTCIWMWPGAVFSQTSNSPLWYHREWSTNFSVPAGHYIGPEKGAVVVNDKSSITWETGSVVSKAEFDIGGESKMFAHGVWFRDIRFGVGLWGRFVAKNSAFENTTMLKTRQWYDKRNSSTAWRFDNCVFVKKFMRDEVHVADISVVAKNCTFIDLKVPVIHYRNNDAANQAQQDWLKFENCRFINCEVNENALLMAVNCVFENCTYTGTSKYWGANLKKPMSITAYWSGRPAASYQQEKLTVTFISTAPPFQAGSTLPYRYERSVLSVPGIAASAAPVQTIGRIEKETTPAAVPENKVASTPAPMPSSPTVTGTSGARLVPLKLAHAFTNALLVVDLPGQGEAGAAVKLSALSLPIQPDASAEVVFNQEVGPQMQTALREVVKFIQIKNGGWPKGQRIELSFAEKYSPKDGPSAAVACALILNSMINGLPLDPEFAVTGDLNADGSVQPIGGIAGKIRGALRAKCSRLAIPAKNLKSVSDVLLLEGPAPFARLEIFSFDKFEKVEKLAQPLSTPDLIQASAFFSEVQAVLFNRGQFNHAALNSPGVQQRLMKIIELVPHHLSAHMLLTQSRGQAPKILSVGGSLDAVDDSGQLLLRSIKSGNQEAMRGLSRDELAVSLNKLMNIRPKLDSRVLPALDALYRFGTELRQWQNQPPQGKTRIAQAWASLKAVAEEADRERAKLASDRDVLEELME